MKTYKIWLTIECENDSPEEEEYENMNEVSIKEFNSEAEANDFCCYLESMADSYKEKQVKD